MNDNADYHLKNIRRKLILLTGLCLKIDNKKDRAAAGQIITELEDDDLPAIEKLILKPPTTGNFTHSTDTYTE